jgi:hypothetical protein
MRIALTDHNDGIEHLDLDNLEAENLRLKILQSGSANVYEKLKVTGFGRL